MSISALSTPSVQAPRRCPRSCSRGGRRPRRSYRATCQVTMVAQGGMRGRPRHRVRRNTMPVSASSRVDPRHHGVHAGMQYLFRRIVNGGLQIICYFGLTGAETLLQIICVQRILQKSVKNLTFAQNSRRCPMTETPSGNKTAARGGLYRHTSARQPSGGCRNMGPRPSHQVLCVTLIAYLVLISFSSARRVAVGAVPTCRACSSTCRRSPNSNASATGSRSRCGNGSRSRDPVDWRACAIRLRTKTCSTRS